MKPSSPACLLAFLLLFTLSPAARAKDAPRYRPLNWEWNKAEIKELKELVKNVKNEADGSLTLETENWRIRTWHTPLFTAQAGKYMEIFSETFFKAFMLKGERGFKDFKPELRVYKSRGDYLTQSGAPEWSAGLCKSSWRCQGGKCVPDINLHTYYNYSPSAKGKGKLEPVFGTQIPLGTIQHEGTHCLLQCIYGPIMIPMWLNEGAASYYEAWLLRAKISESGEEKSDIAARVKRRSFTTGPRSMQGYYAGKKLELPTLDKLLSANTHDLFYCDNGGPQTKLNYDLSESFIDFLMSSRKRRPFMMTVLERVRDQKGVMTADKPFVTDEEMLEYEKDWLEFLYQQWGVPFSKERALERAKELKARVQQKNK